MKILAKTKPGTVLLYDRENYLDEFRYHVIPYDAKVRDWKNRDLIEIKAFCEDSATDSDYVDLGDEGFMNKYVHKEEVEPKNEIEEKVVAVEAPIIEQEKKKSVKNNRKKK